MNKRTELFTVASERNPFLKEPSEQRIYGLYMDIFPSYFFLTDHSQSFKFCDQNAAEDYLWHSEINFQAAGLLKRGIKTTESVDSLKFLDEFSSPFVASFCYYGANVEEFSCFRFPQRHFQVILVSAHALIVNCFLKFPKFVDIFFLSFSMDNEERGKWGYDNTNQTKQKSVKNRKPQEFLGNSFSFKNRYDVSLENGAHLLLAGREKDGLPWTVKVTSLHTSPYSFDAEHRYSSVSF